MKYATIGTSTITQNLIRGAQETGLWELGAVYSRNLSHAREFAAQFGGARAFDDLQGMAASDIDAVYIASPNSLHYEQCKLFLEHGKHVLCEKPLTVLPGEAEELTALARKKGLVFIEAIVMMHQPQRLLVKDALRRIGNITTVRFDFCQRSSRYDDFRSGGLPNIYNPAFATGCIMDMGVYCVYPALDFFGTPERVVTEAGILSSGVDGYFSSILVYPGMQVNISASKVGQGRCGSEIIGDEGTVTIRFIHHLTDIELVHKDGTREPIFGDVEKHLLMAEEMKDFHRYITQPQQTADEYHGMQELAIGVSRVMHEMRRQAGLPF